jgi:hypothetical protein
MTRALLKTAKELLKVYSNMSEDEYRNTVIHALMDIS